MVTRVFSANLVRAGISTRVDLVMKKNCLVEYMFLRAYVRASSTIVRTHPDKTPRIRFMTKNAPSTTSETK